MFFLLFFSETAEAKELTKLNYLYFCLIDMKIGRYVGITMQNFQKKSFFKKVKISKKVFFFQKSKEFKNIQYLTKKYEFFNIFA